MRNKKYNLAYVDCDEMFTDHAVTVYGFLKKGVKDPILRDKGLPMKLYEYWLRLHPLD